MFRYNRLERYNIVHIHCTWHFQLIYLSEYSNYYEFTLSYKALSKLIDSSIFQTYATGLPQLGKGISMNLNQGTTSAKFFCQLCMQGFSDYSQLNKHYEVHGAATKKPASVGKYECSECAKKYMSRQSLKAHLFTAHNIGDSPSKCKLCGEVFKWPALLSAHVKKHHGGQTEVNSSIWNDKNLKKFCVIFDIKKA